MPVTQLPLVRGTGKDYRTADYSDLLPVNMLAVQTEVLGAAGYLRSFPGIDFRQSVSGPSRGVDFNTVQSVAYRVAGGNLYKSGVLVNTVPNSDRVSMAHSDDSQAVSTGGVMRIYRYDGTVKTLDNWPPLSGYPSYDIGRVRDICRARGRYVWVKDGTQEFGVTDLDDESHPDRFRPIYTAETQPDGIIACTTWRDFVIMFGSRTIEYFTITGSTDPQAAIYVAQSNWLVDKGIAGTYCKALYLDTIAFISNQSSGPPSIYLINSGQSVSIATRQIEQILRSYTADEISKAVMESIRFDGHDLLIIHLDHHVLCYDAALKQSQQWCILKTGLFDSPHTAIDFCFENQSFTVGDKLQGRLGTFSFSSSAQYGQQQEHLLYTPMFKADNARLFDFQLEASTGVTGKAERLFISATTDGLNYGSEQMIPWQAPFVYDQRVIWKRIGRVRKNIGFKVRIVTSAPVTLSNCQLRAE
ncbi:packaged DNA stabilization protein [Serratia sp. UGAL515B_01]|uniref:packaged DNA stabilization protein n=1 Tax=Serratia sp. UGAL515B_01 TaxID=2986763 RepID=UPI002954AEB9|nr:packaged DNA stabilization protein [Serratia sp. UGAL515B_01]WON77580.1 packaged DNA stabilization protein gp10 [Serratia sp. UGAL515B_01]